MTNWFAEKMSVKVNEEEVILVTISRDETVDIHVVPLRWAMENKLKDYDWRTTNGIPNVLLDAICEFPQLDSEIVRV